MCKCGGRKTYSELVCHRCWQLTPKKLRDGWWMEKDLAKRELKAGEIQNLAFSRRAPIKPEFEQLELLK